MESSNKDTILNGFILDEKQAQVSDSLYNQLCNINLDMFIEQSYEGQIDSPYNSLRRFQKQVLRVANVKSHTIVASPSQSGKSTVSLGFHIPNLFKPNGNSLIVTNSDDNAEELYNDFMTYILGNEAIEKKLKKVIDKNPKSGLPYKLLTKIESRKSGEFIATTFTNSTFFFTTATESAVSGKSPDRLTLDEVAVWKQSVAKKVYNEAFGRIGQTHGKILSLSTVRTAGEAILKPDGDYELQGNIFYSMLRKILKRQAKEYLPDESALVYTYHVSERLKSIVEKKLMSKEGQKYHYWSIPMSDPKALMFTEYFDRTKHLVMKEDVRNIVPTYRIEDRWMLSIDPGTKSAGVLVQHIDDPCRFIVHEVYENLENETVYQFVKRIMGEIGREYPNIMHRLYITGDVASNQSRGNDQTYRSQIEQATLKPMHVKGQRIEEGVELIKNYMISPSSFYIVAHNSKLIYAFEKALRYKTDSNGVNLNVYEKDGVYDHIVDAMRYALYNATRGQLPNTYRPHSVITTIRTAY